MGRLVSGINGPIQGKVGTVIGSSWRGIPYVKGPYKKRTKKISKKEKANRNRFTVAQYWLTLLTDFVRQGFKGYSLKSQGFVAAKSYLMHNAMKRDDEGYSIDPALVLVSFGDLPLSSGIVVEKGNDGVLHFSWDTSSVEGGIGEDQVMLLAYDIENKKVKHNITGQFRKNGHDSLNPDAKPGSTYHLYMAFTAHDRSRQSNSVYLGAISF